MDDLILHHYPQSPVSEKVRVVLGLKGAAWRSVIIPRVPPKPNLMPLTGGYRMTPVLQIGADIYCDSLCIVEELDRRLPARPLFAADDAGLVMSFSRWTDGPLFTAAAAIVLAGSLNQMPEAFVKDRLALYFGEDMTAERLRADVAQHLANLRQQFAWLDQRLSGSAYLFGATPGFADAAAYYLIWFLRGRYAGGPALLGQFPHLQRWETLMDKVGHGVKTPLADTDALDIARAAEPAPAIGVDAEDPSGFAAGQVVAVQPENNKAETVGTLVGLSRERISVRRDDARVGTIAVHFPRLGYHLRLV